MDYRYSFKPISRLFNGRHIEFNELEPKPINIWNYPNIETGKLPTKRQLAMVLTDILILSKMPRTDAITIAIAATVIDEVYKMTTARNGTGIQIGGINQAAGLERSANQLNFDGRIEAADINLNAATEAAHLRMMSTIVSGFFRNMDWRIEEMKPKY